VGGDLVLKSFAPSFFYNVGDHLVPPLADLRRRVLLAGFEADFLKTQTAMEEWNISNVRSALETGVLRSIVPEQAT
jgi:hypothetical protein